MLDLDCRVREVGDVTLVDAVVESAAPTPRRVRIETALEGPVWPPRRDGVPERGWDGDAFEGVVPADGRLALGFASPAAPTEPPVFVVDHERADPDDERSATPPPANERIDDCTAGRADLRVPVHERTPTGILRALGSPAPPRDAVPVPDASDGPADSQPRTGDREVSGTVAVDEATDPVALPEEVADWLSAVGRRVQRAEALADARRVTTAAGALERAGGLDGARRLTAGLDRDERALRAVARRARHLADRAADADVPLSTLRRLA